jgi:hypothetical protein
MNDLNKDELKDYLKENLSIKVEVDKQLSLADFQMNVVGVRVKLCLFDEVISESYSRV